MPSAPPPAVTSTRRRPSASSSSVAPPKARASGKPPRAPASEASRKIFAGVAARDFWNVALATSRLLAQVVVKVIRATRQQAMQLLIARLEPVHELEDLRVEIGKA